VTGTELALDRGIALENAWKRTPTLQQATLDMWRYDLADGRRPAVLFNATIAETGQQLLLGTTTMPASHGRIDFATDSQFAGVDLSVVTAARLSATFPIVSPPARIDRRTGVSSRVHVVDGGYYDNYGTATLLDWLEQGLRDTTKLKPSRVLILQIRSFPSGPVAVPGEKRGWIFEALQPLETLYQVRGTGQLSQSLFDVQLVTRFREQSVSTCVIEFPRQIASALDDDAPPLSWYLTPADRGQLRNAWNPAALRPVLDYIHEFLRSGPLPVVPDGCRH
jgi:hypothetical protein